MSLDPRDLSFGGIAYLYRFRSSTPPRLCIRGLPGGTVEGVSRFVLYPRDQSFGGIAYLYRFRSSTPPGGPQVSGISQCVLSHHIGSAYILTKDGVEGEARPPVLAGKAYIRGFREVPVEGATGIPVLGSRDRRPEGPSWSVPGRSTPPRPCDRAWSVGVTGRCRSRGFPWIL